MCREKASLSCDSYPIILFIIRIVQTIYYWSHSRTAASAAAVKEINACENKVCFSLFLLHFECKNYIDYFSRLIAYTTYIPPQILPATLALSLPFIRSHSFLTKILTSICSIPPNHACYLLFKQHPQFSTAPAICSLSPNTANYRPPNIALNCHPITTQYLFLLTQP